MNPYRSNGIHDRVKTGPSVNGTHDLGGFSSLVFGPQFRYCKMGPHG